MVTIKVRTSRNIVVKWSLLQISFEYKMSERSECYQPACMSNCDRGGRESSLVDGFAENGEGG